MNSPPPGMFDDDAPDLDPPPGVEDEQPEPRKHKTQADFDAFKDVFANVKAVTEKPVVLRPIVDMARAGLTRARVRAAGKEKPVPMPWPMFARLLGGGYWPGMHVLVAGTGAGKTTWATQIAIEAASQDHPVAYVGLELDEDQIGLRVVAEQAKIGWSKLYLGARSAEYNKAESALADMTGWPLYAEMGDPSGWPASRILSLAEQLSAEHQGERYAGKTPLLVLDFLQLVGNEKSNGRTELRERIGRAAYTARQAARAHNVAVLLVSSTARENYKNDPSNTANVKTEKRDGAEHGIIYNPDALVGLGKESGEIEYAADSVSVLLRYLNEHNMPMWRCLLPKLRYGRPGWVPMVFRERFREIPFSELPEPNGRTPRERAAVPVETPTSDGGFFPMGSKK